MNPPVSGASALAPRLVTPQSLDGLRGRVEPEVTPTADVFADFITPAAKSDNGKSEPGRSEDEAWRREVLERVRKRRHARRHALPLFGEDNSAIDPGAPSADEIQAPESPMPGSPEAPTTAFDGSLSVAPDPNGSSDLIFDLPMRPADTDADPLAVRPRSLESPVQSYVDRSRPTLVGSPVTQRSLVGDLPLVEPSAPPEAEVSRVAVLHPAGPRPAEMADRAQAALIDLGMWSAMSATAFYFASRIARTSIMGLGSAWQGLSLFGLVLAAAYVLFFGGLSGATPGKIACGIQVRRADGSSLGPLASLARGFLGLAGVVLFGVGVWPAFWDKERRALHDRVTDSRVTTV